MRDYYIAILHGSLLTVTAPLFMYLFASLLAGLIIGGFTDMQDTQRPFGKKVYEIIHEHIAEYKYPVCFGFPVSHAKENLALKCGSLYALNINAHNVQLYEP